MQDVGFYTEIVQLTKKLSKKLSKKLYGKLSRKLSETFLKLSTKPKRPTLCISMRGTQAHCALVTADLQPMTVTTTLAQTHCCQSFSILEFLIKQLTNSPKLQKTSTYSQLWFSDFFFPILLTNSFSILLEYQNCLPTRLLVTGYFFSRIPP